MPFVKAKVAAKKAKISEAQILRHARNRLEPDLNLNQAGRRIFDLAFLSQEMWCNACDDAISFRHLREETQRGLASIYKIECHRCKDVVCVKSSAQVLDPDGIGKSLFSVNCKAAVACIDTGVGHDQLNKLLSAMNLPIINRNTIKRAEKRVGPGLVNVAEESCRAAIAEERRLTILKRKLSDLPDGPCDQLEEEAVDCPADVMQMEEPVSTPEVPAGSPRSRSAGPCLAETPSHRAAAANRLPFTRLSRAGFTHRSLSLPPRSPSPLGDDDEELDITVKYDFGWDKRGIGFAYDSRSGRGCMIGQETNLILGYGVNSKDCAMCDKGHEPSDHNCSRNWTGSSKGMEPATAVDLILKNPDLRAAKVRVGTVVGDRDSSTLAALQRESPVPIKKVLDVNHNMKGFSNSLWKLKTSGKHKFLTNESISYFKRCFAYAVAQNKDNVEGTANALLNIAKHTYGEHEECGECCRANEDNYQFKSLLGKKPLSCPVFRKDLELALQNQADNAEQLAPCGSCQQCESFNQMTNTRAPKTRHYGKSQANLYRVSAAVSYKNLGADHLNEVYNHLHLSPSTSGARSYRVKVEYTRQKKAVYKATPVVKRRRIQNKLQCFSKETSSSRKEGATYGSGMAPVMERAASASSVTSWLPAHTQLEDECQFVIVDLETTGFHATAEIVQIAAKCGAFEFCEYMVPSGRISASASDVTGFTVDKGKLLYKGQSMKTTPPYVVADRFLTFFRKCGRQVVLVGHNIVRFDAPRILKWLKQHRLLEDLCTFCHGFVHTLPLISQDKIKKQEQLAKQYLTSPAWQEFLRNAHNAEADCTILDGLLNHFQIDHQKLARSVKTMRIFLEDQARAKRRNENAPALKPLSDAGIFAAMVKRMAEHNVTIEELVKAYRSGGRKALEVCLSVQVNGKPRITSSKKITEKVASFVEGYIGENQ